MVWEDGSLVTSGALNNQTVSTISVASQVSVGRAISIVSATAALPSALSAAGYLYVGSNSSLYWVNGSGVSTLVA